MATPANRNISTLKRTRIDIWRTEVAHLSPSASATAPTIASSSAPDTASLAPSHSSEKLEASSNSTHDVQAARTAANARFARQGAQLCARIDAEVRAHEEGEREKERNRSRAKKFWRKLARRLSLRPADGVEYKSRTFFFRGDTPVKDETGSAVGGFGEGWMLNVKPSEDVWDRDVRTEMWQVTAENLSPEWIAATEAAVAAAAEVEAMFDSSGSGDIARKGDLKKSQERLQRAARLLDQGAKPTLAVA